MKTAKEILKQWEGKEVVLQPTGNYSRRDNTCKQVKLLKVARTLVTIDLYGETKYRIGSALSNKAVSISFDNSNGGYIVHENIALYNSHIKLEKAKQKIYRKISEGWGNCLNELTASDIYQIAKILNIGESDE